MSPNRNYERGVRHERELKQQLEAAGLVVLRSAGSHGFADLTAIRRGGQVTFYQVKAVGTQAEVTRLFVEFRKNPPITPSAHYHTCLAVKLRGQRGFQEAYA